MLHVALGFAMACLSQPGRAFQSSSSLTRHHHNREQDRRYLCAQAAFKRTKDRVYFGTKYEIDECLDTADHISLAAFLADEAAVMAASWPADKTAVLDPGTYRFVQERITFGPVCTLDLHIDFHVKPIPGEGKLLLESRGLEVTACFPRHQECRLVDVDLSVRGELAAVPLEARAVPSSPSAPIRTQRGEGLLGWRNLGRRMNAAAAGEAEEAPAAEGAAGGGGGVKLAGFLEFDTSGPLTGSLALAPTLALRLAARAVMASAGSWVQRDLVAAYRAGFVEWVEVRRREPALSMPLKPVA